MQVKEKTITKEMLINYISRYRGFEQEIREYEGQIAKLNPAASTGRYGIEASMPRASGDGHSDPTFVQATQGYVSLDPYIRRRMRIIKEVDKRGRNIHGDVERRIFVMWLNGLNNLQIAQREKISESAVRRRKEKILSGMLEEQVK